MRAVNIKEGRVVAALLLVTMVAPGLCLKCYNDGQEQIVKCDENLGYRTCFIRYNEKGGITGRGCSTKDKVYYKECETNSYGEGTEKFCYCNFYLCNSSPTQFGSHSPILLTVILAPLLMSALQRSIMGPFAAML